MPDSQAAAPASQAPAAQAPGAQGTPPAAAATPEEAASRMAEKDRVISELSERAKRSEEMLQAFMAGGAGQPPAPAPAAPAQPEDVLGLGPDFDWVKDGKKALEQTFLKAKAEAKKEALEEAQRMYQYQEQSKITRDAFYTKHADLKGQEPIVHHFANVLDKEMPYATTATKFEEIAKRSRDYLAKLRAPVPPEPSVPAEGAGGFTPPAGAPAGAAGRLPSDEEIFRQGFEEKSQAIAKKKMPLASSL